MIAQRLHAQDSDVSPYQDWQNFLFKTVVVRVHHVEGHLHGIERELMFGSGIEHFEMNLGTLVSRESDEADFAGFFRFENSFESSARSEDSVGISIANHLVELQQVNVVRLKTPQRFLDLRGGTRFCPAINFRHQKGFVTITILEGLTHANFALAAVIVPAVIQEIESFVEGLANDRDAFVGITLRTQVVAADADERNLFARAAKFAVGNAVLGFGLGVGRRKGCLKCSGEYSGGSPFQEGTTAHSVRTGEFVKVRWRRFHRTLLCFSKGHSNPLMRQYAHGAKKNSLRYFLPLSVSARLRPAIPLSRRIPEALTALSSPSTSWKPGQFEGLG